MSKYLQITAQKPGVNHQSVNTPHNSRSRKELAELNRQNRITRAMEYQGLLDKNGWSKAELARQMGVSRAWITTVLKDKATDFQ